MTVRFNDEQGQVISTQEDMATFTMNPATNASCGYRYKYEVSICNYGNALLALTNQDDLSMTLMPHISSISPTSGSTAGGTLVTVQGGCFSTQTSVTIDTVQCVKVSVDYNQIICKTAASTEGEQQVSINVNIRGQVVAAKCRTPTGTCTYSFNATQTPEVTSLSLANLQMASHTLTINGTNLGSNQNAITVMIGNTKCRNATFVTEGTSFTCVADKAVQGIQPVSVHVSGMGLAELQPSLTTIPVYCRADHLTQTSGSEAGGLATVVVGYGFHQDTSVKVSGNDWCQPNTLTVAHTKVDCVTTAGNGSVNVTITSDSQHCGTILFTYTDSDTPTITAISPDTGTIGDVLTINGTHLSGSSAVVMVGTASCQILTQDETNIVCTLTNHPAGTVNVSVTISNKGKARDAPTFSYQLSITSISHSTGQT